MAEQDTAAGAAATGGAVTDYEKRRQENILRNQQMLLQLGLTNGRSPILASLDDSASNGATGRYRASPAGTKRARTPPQPVKQSRRLRGEAPPDTFAVRRRVLHTLGSR